jgi:hypothetical protein
MKTLDTVHALASFFAVPAFGSAAVIAWQDDVIVRGNINAMGLDRSEPVIWGPLGCTGEPPKAAATALPEAAADGH